MKVMKYSLARVSRLQVYVIVETRMLGGIIRVWVVHVILAFHQPALDLPGALQEQ